jgi:Kae1-associated kinase Bud32
MTELGRGAEATITRTEIGVRKSREQKAYRHPELDKRLRQFRTRREATVLQKLPVKGPKLISVNDSDMTIDMSFIDGFQLRDVITPENMQGYMHQLGKMLADIHNAGIVHGDLTSSNILVKDDQLYLIDFGLSEFSDHIEQYAVDLHLLKHSLEAKHPYMELFTLVWDSYAPSQDLRERFEEVEGRGRYKGKQ